jgi:hypothetical protein
MGELRLEGVRARCKQSYFNRTQPQVDGKKYGNVSQYLILACKPRCAEERRPLPYVTSRITSHPGQELAYGFSLQTVPANLTR